MAALELTPGTDVAIDAGDLVATAQAGVTLAALDAQLAAHGAWLALDPPESGSLTLGEALLSGAGGPLAAGFGPPRDQVLGLTFVTGTGAVVKTGGRVVKNVAGFELAKLLIGSHGAFATIIEAHLRLRIRPACDRTLYWSGSRSELARYTGALMRGGVNVAAFEVIDHGRPLLALRAMGSDTAVDEELAACAVIIGRPGSGGEQPGDWSRAPVRLRIGADPDAWLDALDLAERAFGAIQRCSVTVPRGTVRVGLHAADASAITSLRRLAAQRGWPVTIERGPRELLRAAGIWGELNAGVLELTKRLKLTYDPDGALGVPLLAS